MRNNRAAGDARHARTGKDGAFYSANGVMLASVESFSSSVSFTNSKCNFLGDAQEHETPSSFSVSLTMTQIVIEDDEFIVGVFDYMKTGIAPYWHFQGSLEGLNGSEERVVYRDCMLSGQVDLQNITVGDVIKRNWNFFVNRPPELQNLLSIG